MASCFTQSTALYQALVKLGLQKLGHADILAQTLAPPRLEHKVSRRRLRVSHLQRTEDNVLIERITGNNVPPVEHQTDHGLAGRVDPQIGLEAETVDDGQQAVDAVERGAGNGTVGEDVAATAGQDVVNGADGVLGTGHGDRVHGLHQARRGHQERTVAGAAGSGDDLTTAPEDGLLGKRYVDESELGIAYCWFHRNRLAPSRCVRGET